MSVFVAVNTSLCGGLERLSAGAREEVVHADCHVDTLPLQNVLDMGMCVLLFCVMVSSNEKKFDFLVNIINEKLAISSDQAYSLPATVYAMRSAVMPSCGHVRPNCR